MRTISCRTNAQTHTRSSDGTISYAEGFLIAANEAVFGDIQAAKMKGVTAIENHQVGATAAFYEGTGGRSASHSRLWRRGLRVFEYAAELMITDLTGIEL